MTSWRGHRGPQGEKTPQKRSVSQDVSERPERPPGGIKMTTPHTPPHWGMGEGRETPPRGLKEPHSRDTSKRRPGEAREALTWPKMTTQQRYVQMTSWRGQRGPQGASKCPQHAPHLTWALERPERPSRGLKGPHPPHVQMTSWRGQRAIPWGHTHHPPR